MRVLACLFALIAAAATAQPSISLKALSADGERAVMAFGQKWVEVGLTEAGGARALQHRWSCSWTSASYAAEGVELAMTEYCPPIRDACDQGESSLWIRTIGRDAERLASKKGEQWGELTWRSGRRDALLLRRKIYIPPAANLNELVKKKRDCDYAAARLSVAQIDTGRLASFDILPEGWRADALVSGDGRGFLAGVTGFDAEAGDPLAAEICERRPGYCMPNRPPAPMIWEDGEWRLASDAPRALRVLATPDRSVQVIERCGGSVRAEGVILPCAFFVTSGGIERRVGPIGPRWNDARLSANGRWLALLRAPRAAATADFTMIDLESGEVQDLTRLMGLRPPFDRRPLMR